jgi:serine protease Do
MEPLKDASGASQNKMTSLKQNRFAPIFVGSVAVALVLLIGTVLTFTAHANSVNSTDAPQLTVPAFRQHDNEFARIAKAVDPAVVNVSTESTVKNPHRRMHRMPQPNNPNGPDEEQGPDSGNPNNGLQDWFDRFFGQQPDSGGPSGPGGGGDMTTQSLGSGVIVSPNG